MKHIYNCTGHALKLPHIVSSQGAYLSDASGKRYVDMESGIWCAAVGQNNPRINAVIQKQAGTLMHAGYCYSNEIVDRAAEKLLSIADFENGGVVFLCSGSEAIELGRQMAKHLTGKSLSMTLHDSYLGSYSSVTNRSTGWYMFDWEQCKTCPKQDECDKDCPLLAAVPQDISEFIFEPGSSGGFVRFPPKAVINNLASLVRAKKGMIVINEVTTGMGRTGKWFGYEHYGLDPDIICTGKGIGNGYPVSATVINQATLEQLRGGTFKYVQSHQNDPMGAAIAHEVLSIFEEQKLPERAARLGRQFKAELESLIDGSSITAVRGRGLILAVDLANEQVGDIIFERLLESGYIVCNRKGLFRIDPPLIINEDDLHGFVEALDKARP